MRDIDKLKINIEGHQLYGAGVPSFPRNFSRDAIISAILMQNMDMMKNQLNFCALKQGKKKDKFTGEEPGKIFHEYPAVNRRGLSPEFNASDSTAMFLIGHEVYQRMTNDKELAIAHKEHIHSAVNYIKSHIKHGAFIESPKFCGAEKFSLRVTYWKDSEIVDRVEGIPKFPVVYLLAHVQNLRGLRSAYFLLRDEEILKIISKMKRYLIRKLYNRRRRDFHMAIDKKGKINAISTDSLHALFYLNSEDLQPEMLDGIVKNSEELETQFGYRCLSDKDTNRVGDPYHSITLWPFEQAIINIGAKKFGLRKVDNVSSRIKEHLSSNPEVYEIIDTPKGRKFKGGGCDPQLWTIAARQYFKNPKKYKMIV